MKKRITAGKLRNGQDFHMKPLAIEDLSVILNLQKKVGDTLENKTFLKPLSREEFTSILSGNGYMIGVFVGENMIAFRAMALPPLDEEHLGIDVGLSHDDLPSVIYSETSNVDPDYRGNGLQTFMGRLVMEAVDINRYRYVCATVSPFNIPSLKDKFNLGMEISAIQVKYGNMLRYIFMIDLLAPKENRTLNREALVAMDEIEKQTELLHSGFIGTSMKMIDGKWYVRYCNFSVH